MKKVILASGSPRRRELLGKLNLVFTVQKAECEERITREAPEEAVEELALLKAEAIGAGAQEEAYIIGSDTVVVLDGKILGKPKDTEEAIRMLKSLQGRSHQVCTGVAVLEKGSEGEKVHTFHETAEVTLYPMTEEEITAYVKTGDPLDKAGAYGIQGPFAVYVKRICGDYNTIVGFPLARFYQEMKNRFPFL